MSRWKWAITVENDTDRVDCMGETDAPDNATGQSILPGIAKGLVEHYPEVRGGSVTRFEASRTDRDR